MFQVSIPYYLGSTLHASAVDVPRHSCHLTQEVGEPLTLATVLSCCLADGFSASNRRYIHSLITKLPVRMARSRPGSSCEMKR